MDEGIFDCCICTDKLDDAMETKCCHHCFCKRCIDEWMRVKKSCPSCRKSITAQDIVPNVPIQRMVNNLPSECPNKSRGCQSKLTRGIVKEHVLTSCEFEQVLCPSQCGMKVPKKELGVHQSNVCTKRLAPCVQCALMVTADAMLEHLLNKCPKSRILCPDCKISLFREQLHPHQQKECMKITLKCPFAQFGCQFTGLRPQYKEHLIEDSDIHVGVVIEREERMSNEITKLKNELAKLKGGKAGQKDRNKFSFEELLSDLDFSQPPKKGPEVPANKPSFGSQNLAAPSQPNFAPQPNRDAAQPNVPTQPFVFNFNSPNGNNVFSFQ